MARRLGPVRAELEVLQHRAEAARMYLQGYTQAEIGSKLGVSQQQVSEDLKAVRTALQANALGNMAQWMAEEIARTRMIERESWREWERSKRPRKLRGTKKVENSEKQDRDEEWERTEERLGDPRYLERILWCLDYRAELLGLKAARRTELSGPDGGPITVESQVVTRSMVAVIEQRLREAGPEERDRFIGSYESLVSSVDALMPLLGDADDDRNGQNGRGDTAPTGEDLPHG